MIVRRQTQTATAAAPGTHTVSDTVAAIPALRCALFCLFLAGLKTRTLRPRRPAAAAAHLSVVPSGPTLPVCTPSSFLTSSQTCRGEGRGVRGPKVVAAHNAFWGGMRSHGTSALLTLLHDPSNLPRTPPGLCAAHGKFFAPPSCAALSCGSWCLFFCCYPRCPWLQFGLEGCGVLQVEKTAKLVTWRAASAWRADGPPNCAGR